MVYGISYGTTTVHHNSKDLKWKWACFWWIKIVIHELVVLLLAVIKALVIVVIWVPDSWETVENWLIYAQNHLHIFAWLSQHHHGHIVQGVIRWWKWVRYVKFIGVFRMQIGRGIVGWVWKCAETSRTRDIGKRSCTFPQHIPDTWLHSPLYARFLPVMHQYGSNDDFPS